MRKRSPKQILPTNTFRKCTEISHENLYVDIGAYRVKRGFQTTGSRGAIFEQTFFIVQKIACESIWFLQLLFLALVLTLLAQDTQKQVLFIICENNHYSLYVQQGK